MALELVVDTLDKVPEALRTEYTEKEGKFHLNVNGIEDTTGLKNALASERKMRAEFERITKGWEKLGKTPDEISKMVADEQAKAEEALKKAGKFDEVLAKHKSDWAADAKTREDKLIAERDAAMKSERDAIVETRVTAALTAAKATKEGLDLLTERLGKRLKFDIAADGSRTISILAVDGTPMVGSGSQGLATMEDLVKEAVKTYPSLFEGTGAGGSGSPTKDTRPGAKQIKRAEWDAMNPFEQAKKIKEGYTPVD